MDSQRYADASTTNHVCPECGSGEVRVIDSRLGAHQETRRRRKCKSCSAAWSTVEMPKDRADRFRAMEGIVDKLCEMLRLGHV